MRRKSVRRIYMREIYHNFGWLSLPHDCAQAFCCATVEFSPLRANGTHTHTKFNNVSMYIIRMYDMSFGFLLKEIIVCISHGFAQMNACLPLIGAPVTFMSHKWHRPNVYINFWPTSLSHRAEQKHSSRRMFRFGPPFVARSSVALRRRHTSKSIRHPFVSARLCRHVSAEHDDDDDG